MDQLRGLLISHWVALRFERLLRLPSLLAPQSTHKLLLPSPEPPFFKVFSEIFLSL
jgi:hypothetical protein